MRVGVLRLSRFDLLLLSVIQHNKLVLKFDRPLFIFCNSINLPSIVFSGVRQRLFRSPLSCRKMVAGFYWSEVTRKDSNHVVLCSWHRSPLEGGLIGSHHGASRIQQRRFGEIILTPDSARLGVRVVLVT